MKTVGIIGGIIVLLVLGFFAFNSFIYNEKQGTGEEVAVASSPEYGFEFTYRTAPYGYRLTEVLPGEQGDADLRKVYVLMLEDDYEALQNSPEPREGPPTINIAVYEKTGDASPDEWVAEHPLVLNLDLITSGMYPVTVGGVSGLRFTSDGLYATENVLVEHGGYMFHITGGYLDRESLIAEDFEALLKTVAFIAEEA